MQIISWNCNGRFRGKYAAIIKEFADVYVIQKCENPALFAKEFSNIFSDYRWTGENNNKGLAVFARGNIKMQDNHWPSYALRNFLSLKIEDKYDLVGIWACRPYIEEYYVYQSININRYSENTILIGDFNSNAKWDKKHGRRSHTNVVNELKKTDIVSAYHHFNHEKEGEEKQATFYLYRHTERPYHIDYCFASAKKLKSYEILKEGWLKLSDHLPIKVEFK